SCCRAVTVRSRGFCPCPVVKPSFQVFSRSAKATNKVPAVMLSCTLRVAGVVMGFLLHSDRLRVMEKNRTNSGPLRAPAAKHRFSTIKQPRGFEEVASHGFAAVLSHVHWVYCAYLLLHMAPPGLSPGAQSIGDKQSTLQQALADKEKRQILQKLTQIGGVQRYKDELRQALARH